MLKISSLILILLLNLALCSAEEVNSSLYQNILGMKEYARSHPKQALQQLTKIETEAKTNKSTYLLWLLRFAQAQNYSYQFSKFDETVKLGMSLIDENTSPEIQGMFQIYKGVFYQRAGDYESSFEILLQANNLGQKYNLPKVETLAQVELAYSHALAEQFETALVTLQKAYVRSKENNYPFLEAQANEVYGVAYTYMGKFEDSIRYYNRALQYYESVNYAHFIAEASYGMASAYRYWGKWDLAIQQLEKYKQVLADLSSDYTEFYYLYGKGMSLALKGDCINALSVIDAGIKKDKFIDYIAELYKKKASCNAKLGKFTQAQEALNQAKIIFNNMPEMKGTTWDIDTIKVAAEIALLQGEYKKAYDLINEYYILLLKVKEKNNSKSFEKLKIDLQKQREKLETAILESESQVQKLKLGKQSREIAFQRLLLIGSIVLIIIILGWMWWQWRVSKKLQSLAVTDELTGLFNRRYIFSTIENILENNHSNSLHHTLMLVDLDNLKPINDDHGHQDGDKALKAVAKAGISVSRASDVFARIGGDEYMLLLTRSTPELEPVIAERILKAVADSSIKLESGDILPISVSIGIATIDNPDESLESIYSRVDEALYRAKAAGRNCYSK